MEIKIPGCVFWLRDASRDAPHCVDISKPKRTWRPPWFLPKRRVSRVLPEACEADRSLDLSAAGSRLLVVPVCREFTGLGRDALGDIIDEGVHDGHALLRDTGIGVNLLEHLVDVRRVRLGMLLALRVAGGIFRGRDGRLLGGCFGHG